MINMYVDSSAGTDYLKSTNARVNQKQMKSTLCGIMNRKILTIHFLEIHADTWTKPRGKK